ncbi:MAG: response regulator [Magnetococcus sp. YQC-5]
MNKVDPIRVVLVDDSTISQALIKRLLAPFPEILVVGVARNGRDGLQCVAELNPHVICTDLFMPVMNGLAFTRAVMEQFPRPILVITASLQEAQPYRVFDLLAAGALDLFYKPDSWSGPEAERISRSLAAKIRLLAGLGCNFNLAVNCMTTIPQNPVPAVNMVVIGAGIGGPQVLREILSGLDADFPVPILCVVHLDAPFHLPLIQWLGQQTPMLVQEGAHGEMPMAGSVYLPPVGQHMILDGQGRIALSQAPPVAGHRPSITVTMESVAEYFGGAMIGVLLSGIGQDGVRGMAAITHAKGVTMAQDDISSLAFEMPRQAIELGVATHILPCTTMAAALLNLTGKTEIDLRLASTPPDPEVPSMIMDTAHAIPLLIVEDSAIQAFKLRKFLQETGFAVTVAKDGQEGLELTRRMRPRLVISDVSMPRMNGFQLCHAIKSDPQLRDIHVMLLTALTNPDEILEGLSAGANNYLVKPWDGDHLLTMINQALTATPQSEQAGENLDIVFDNKTYTVTSSRRQILDLLMTTYQKAVRQNKELMDSQLEMKMLNLQLVEMYAKETGLNQQLQQDMNLRKQLEADQARTLRELEEANRELDDFAFIIAHDLKTPLRGIGSLTNWLLADFADQLAEEGRDLVGLLAVRADRINLLIEALLQYTRVSRINEELTDVDLNKVVAGVIKELVIPEEMDILIDSRLPVIRFQENRAIQIFHGLIDNAVRHMGKPSGVVHIGLEPEDGLFWRFWVSDTGPGIDEKYFDKIFGIFQTLQPRDDVETAGMGLALIKKIVEKYGGRIWVESQLGQGSCFYFTVPKQVTPMLQVHGRKLPRS